MLEPEIIPNSSLIIARRAFRNNSSKYSVNGRESTFTQVTSLLKSHGVDLDHKRFLILQGEVESIAQMKPKATNEHDDGLLEYLEDIIGTSKYKDSIKGLEQQLEELNDVCREKGSRLEIVRKERAGLSDARNAALDYLHKENTLTMRKSSLYQLTIAKCRQNLHAAATIVTEIKSQLPVEESGAQSSGLQAKIAKCEEQQQSLHCHIEQLAAEEKDVSIRLNGLEKQYVKLKETQRYLVGKHKKLSKTRQAAEHGTSEAQSWCENYKQEIDKRKGIMDELRDRMEKEKLQLAEIREELGSRTRDLSEGIEIRQKQLQPFLDEISAIENNMEIARAELDLLAEKDRAREQELQIAREHVDNTAAELGSKSEAKQRVKDDLNALFGRVRRDTERLERERKELNRTQAEYSSIKARYDEAHSASASSKSRSSMSAGLARLRDSGRIRGFHGRLGDLGAISDKYDVAITTACPALNNMVVDTVEVGQACIEHLRRNNLGRAVFIVLDQLSVSRQGLDLPGATPENVPRLFDLVKPVDQKFAPAFYSVLQNTLVADTLEQANRIAYGGKQRWRVVTLDGQLIDKSGTMTGGGTRVSRGGMSSNATASAGVLTAEQLAALNTEQTAALQRLREQEALVSDIEAALESAQQLDQPALEMEQHKIQLEHRALEARLHDAQNELSRVQQEHRQVQYGAKAEAVERAQTMKGLESQIAQGTADISRVRERSQALENEIQTLQDRIMEMGGVRLRSQKARVDGLQEQLDTQKSQQKAAEVSLMRAQKDIEKHGRTIETVALDLGNVEEQMVNLDEEFQQLKSTRSELESVVENLRNTAQDDRDAIADLQTSIDNMTEQLNQQRAREIELRNRLSENEKIIEENERRKQHYKELLMGLRILRAPGKENSKPETVAGSMDVDNDEPPNGEDNEEDDMCLVEYSADELAEMDRDTLKRQISELEEELKDAKADLEVLSEYERRTAEFNARSGDLAQATENRDTAKANHADLTRRRHDEFMDGFHRISATLKEMYQLITLGGNAELELVDSLDPFSEGVLFSVMPPKKSWKNISNLSGGEKTLSSLALVFSLHHYKPTPLYVMDEIDAALDFRNVSIVANYIKERTKNAQFVVISLRNNMFELAARLIGIYKTNNRV